MDKLVSLRNLMEEHCLDAYIIPSGDPHASEYTPDCFNARKWFSGFTGSAGLVVVMKDKAGLWTDVRYYIQAAKELKGTNIELFKRGQPGVPDYEKFLAENLGENARVGFDGNTFTVDNFDKLKKALIKKSVSYSYQNDLVGKLWLDRPSVSQKEAFEHELKFAGISATEKLENLREEMKEKEIEACLVTALDGVAWLTNMRGYDLQNTPVVYAFALVTKEDAFVFVDPKKVKSISSKLTSQGFTLKNYEDLPEFLGKLKTKNIHFNKKTTNVLLSESIPEEIIKITKEKHDIILNQKAIKSKIEIANIKNAYIKEGAVLVKMLVWLEKALKSGQKLFEGDVTCKLKELRSEQEHYLFDSFDTISAYGSNAAIIHYNAGEKGDEIKPSGFLLVDTGGQYLDGTTDTTRTIPVGETTDEMKEYYTYVLKGLINLTRVRFPDNTRSNALDVFARKPLWDYYANYGHGTGHGIGYCLGVHEGPNSISPAVNETVPKPGMIYSNEPGFYKEGEYGIRLENTIMVVECCKNSFGSFLGFETLMLCPFDLDTIDLRDLTDMELVWLNDYHMVTYDRLSPFLNEDEKAWLKNATRRIEEV